MFRVCLLILLTAKAWAGDAAQLNFLGFAEDGKHLAFQEYGVEDGSGFAFANSYFIDVAANKYADNPIRTTSDSARNPLSAQAIRLVNLGQSTDRLKKLDIVTDNVGQHVIAHVLNDVGVEAKQVQFASATPLTGLAYNTYTIKLDVQETDMDCFGLGKAKIFTLKLINDKTEQEKVLQKDDDVPKSRGCPLDYRIQSVYLYQQKSLVIFLNMFLPGFEGQSMRYLAVTGLLN